MGLKPVAPPTNIKHKDLVGQSSLPCPEGSRMSAPDSPPHSLLQDRWQVAAEPHLITHMLSGTPRPCDWDNESISYIP
jgi:hypothetical protein